MKAKRLHSANDGDCKENINDNDDYKDGDDGKEYGVTYDFVGFVAVGNDEENGEDNDVTHVAAVADGVDNDDYDDDDDNGDTGIITNDILSCCC
jgi:hypothetical protein